MALLQDFQEGEKVKTPFGNPKDNKYRRGIFRGISKTGRAMIEVKQGNKFIIIERFAYLVEKEGRK